MTHICVSKLTIISSDNGLSPGRRQAIIWTNAGILSIEPLGTNFSEILIEIHTFSFKKMHLKMSSGKWRPFCLDLNVLTAVGTKALKPNISLHFPFQVIQGSFWEWTQPIRDVTLLHLSLAGPILRMIPVITIKLQIWKSFSYMIGRKRVIWLKDEKFPFHKIHLKMLSAWSLDLWTLILGQVTHISKLGHQLVQIVTCCLCGAKPLAQPLLCI